MQKLTLGNFQTDLALASMDLSVCVCVRYYPPKDRMKNQLHYTRGFEPISINMDVTTKLLRNIDSY